MKKKKKKRMVAYKFARKLQIVQDKSAEKFNVVKVTCSRDVVDFARNLYSDDIEIFESMFLLLLNQANKITGWAKISQGGVSGTVADPIIIAKYCIDALAKGAILVHNHPSGNTYPSNADKSITLRIKQLLELFDCKLMDHVILTAESYSSMADDGMI